MSLPPLPLIDGCLFCDNSGWLENMQTCYRLLEYKSLHKRIQAGERAALNFGSAIHLALEHRYRKYQNQFLPESYYGEVVDMFLKFFADHEPSQNDWRNLNWAVTTIRRYNERYDIEDFQLLTNEKNEVLVEIPFSLPLFTWHGDLPGYGAMDIPIFYTGRIDLPIVIDNQIFVMDHKSTGMLGQQFFERMKMSSQQKGYCWALRKTLDKPVAGYIVNAIRTKQPPLYVQKGDRDGRKTPEMWWKESLQRERYFVDDIMLVEWEQNVIALIKEFFHNYQMGYMPMKTTQCTNFGRCPYYDICSLTPQDRGVMLASNLYQDNTWDPLHEATQPKAT